MGMITFNLNLHESIPKKVKEKEHELFLKINRENFNELTNGH